MSQYDMHEAYAQVSHLIRESPDMASGMKAVLAYCEQIQPDCICRYAREFDYLAEAQLIVQWVEDVLREQPPPDWINGFWFGLTNSFQQEQVSCAMYLAGSSMFDPEDNTAQWVTESEYVPVSDVGIRLAPSAVFQRFYELAYSRKDGDDDAPDCAVLLDYVLCLSFAGLAVREVCRSADRRLMLGGRAWRGIATGFDDGDFLLLGRLTEQGLQLMDQPEK
ncbi:hypothetical protein JXA32_09185 [Candidatus Sumerlaeota bacterium]|nr:hypothetical protein [Candidatus Sumerlaeota bacterium]